MIHKTQGREAQFTGFSIAAKPNLITIETKDLPLFRLEMTEKEALDLGYSLVAAVSKAGE
jgi:hypothetical protein